MAVITFLLANCHKVNVNHKKIDIETLKGRTFSRFPCERATRVFLFKQSDSPLLKWCNDLFIQPIRLIKNDFKWLQNTLQFWVFPYGGYENFPHSTTLISFYFVHLEKPFTRFFIKTHNSAQQCTSHNYVYLYLT